MSFTCLVHVLWYTFVSGSEGRNPSSAVPRRDGGSDDSMDHTDDGSEYHTEDDDDQSDGSYSDEVWHDSDYSSDYSDFSDDDDRDDDNEPKAPPDTDFELQDHFLSLGYAMELTIGAANYGEVLSDAMYLTMDSTFYDACELLTKREYFHIPIVDDMESRELIGTVPRSRLQEIIALQEELAFKALNVLDKKSFVDRLMISMGEKFDSFKKKYINLEEEDDESKVADFRHIVGWRKHNIHSSDKDLVDDGA